MLLSDILLDKLNSDAELSKRVQLAKNVFISMDLRIAYKEEYILLWFLKSILESKEEDDKRVLIDGFCLVVKSDAMVALPSSGVRSNAKTNISKYLTKVVKNVKNHADLIDSTLVVVRKFFLHFKSHPKQFVSIMYPLLSESGSDQRQAEILALASDIFRGGVLHEKFVLNLMKKDFHLLFERLTHDDDANLILFIQKTFFRKDTLPHFQATLSSVCSNEKISVDSPLVEGLISSLHYVHTSDVHEEVKIRAFCKVFQSFAKSNSDEANSTILQFFLLLCHLLGLEQLVRRHHAHAIINEDHFREAFNVQPPAANAISYAVARHLIQCLSQESPDLTSSLSGSTYLDWFHSLVQGTVAEVENLSREHIDFFRVCSDLDSTIVEKNFKKIFSSILKQTPERFESDDFVSSYNGFMDKALKMFSKLQRIHKFVSKLLLSVRSTNSSLSLKFILPDSFVAEFTNIVSLLPSGNTMKFMEDLVNTLRYRCVASLEDNSGSVNALLTQVTCSLASAFLSGVRVLNHSIPRVILQGFVEELSELKNVLGRFGRALLVRIHDREIVQPFLNLCFHWGEFELLVVNYAEEHSEQLTNKDISPTDLSTLHSYLNGEEWNVLAERVSNFGAVQCYRLFLKLILQKLRLLQLKKCHALINAEATCKYILVQLTSDLYKHDIVEELTPEDFGFVCEYLPRSQHDILLDKLYSRAFDDDGGRKLLDWIADSPLVENRSFFVLSFVVVLRKIATKLNSGSRRSEPPHASLSLDFIDESCELIRDSFLKLVDAVDDVLREPANATIPAARAKQFETCIEVVTRVLPVKCVPRDVLPFAVTALTYLAVVFAEDEPILRSILVAIRDLLATFDDVSSCFNVGLCLKWLLRVSDDDWDSVARDARNGIARALLKKGAHSEKALNELEDLVRSIRKKDVGDSSKSLELQVRLYQDLGKSWIRNKKVAAENERISNFRRRLSKRIRKELEAQVEMDEPSADPEVLVAAYATELTRAVKKGNLAELVKLNFEQFFDAAVSKVNNGSHDNGYYSFLSTLLVHWQHVKDHAQISLRKLWSALRFHPRTNRKLLYDLATETEIKFFFRDLLKTWTVFPEGHVDAKTYLGTWQELCSQELSRERHVYEKYLKRFFGKLSANLSTVRCLSPEKATHLFDFFHYCISTPEIVMTSPMIDAFLDVAISYDMRGVTGSGEFESVFKACANAVSWLCTTRAHRMKDKIHVVFEVFARLVGELARRSDASLSLSDADLLSLSSCAYLVEKWSSIMAKRGADFARVSVYFVAELVSSFVRIGLYPAVKDPLVNGINNFLTVSDSHDVGHLARVLDPGSQQIFNGIYDKYNRYRKFTGKT